MRFGCCVTPEEMPIIAQAGFDYCELPGRALLPFESDSAALPALRALTSPPLPIEGFNAIVPPELPLVGPTADTEAIRTYFRRLFGRMAQLGGQVTGLGSGAARTIPAGMPRDRALDQLAVSLAIATEESARAGIQLALEALNHTESNVFNSVAECQEFIRDRGLKELYLLADLHHLEMEHEPLADVEQAAPMLVHAHVADGGRRAPGVGGYDYAGFMRTLHGIGYDRRISAECNWEDLGAQAAGALDYMRQQWAQAAGD